MNDKTVDDDLIQNYQELDKIADFSPNGPWTADLAEHDSLNRSDT